MRESISSSSQELKIIRTSEFNTEDALTNSNNNNKHRDSSSKNSNNQTPKNN